MTSSLETVKEVYDCFGRGDFEGFLNLCDQNIEWVVNGPANLKKCTAFQGHAGVRQFLDILGSSWEFSSFNTKQFFTDKNTVIVLGEETGKEKDSNTPFENRWAHVFDVNNGKITRFREFLCHWTKNQKPPRMSW